MNELLQTDMGQKVVHVFFKHKVRQGDKVAKPIQIKHFRQWAAYLYPQVQWISFQLFIEDLLDAGLVTLEDRLANQNHDEFYLVPNRTVQNAVLNWAG